MPETAPAPVPPAQAPPPLLMTARAAAEALAVCQKTLWSLTRAGRLPCVRIGRAVRYDLADVRRFIEANKDTRGGNHEPL